MPSATLLTSLRTVRRLGSDGRFGSIITRMTVVERALWRMYAPHREASGVGLPSLLAPNRDRGRGVIGVESAC